MPDKLKKSLGVLIEGSDIFYSFCSSFKFTYLSLVSRCKWICGQEILLRALWPRNNVADFDQKTTEYATKPVEEVGTEQLTVEHNADQHPQKPLHQQKQNKQKTILSGSRQNKYIQPTFANKQANT